MQKTVVLVAGLLCSLGMLAMDTQHLHVTLSSLSEGTNQKHTLLLDQEWDSHSIDMFNETSCQLKRITFFTAPSERLLKIGRITLENLNKGKKSNYTTLYTLEPGDAKQLEYTEFDVRVQFEVAAN